MKKNVLALSITAALVGFGFASGAHANGTGATATALELSPSGIGHMLLVPYYSAQSNNATLINIVNTDTVNGKAVKVRFRGAANSDDVFDFQVFLSPGDAWSANVSKGADGRATLTTNDNSCTKPAKSVLNSNGFVTARLDSKLTGDALANQTREGYVEIFNMADIQPATVAADSGALFTAIKHVSSVPPCSGTAWTDLDSLATSDQHLAPPTGTLLADWIIINTVDAGAWSGQATAVMAVSGAAGAVAAGAGNQVYWPQMATTIGSTTAASYTADPLMQGTAPIVQPSLYDLPDMSTPYVSGANGASPTAQAKALSTSIATNSITNEFLTNPAIHATTDWTISMPTRRYSVALNYNTTLGTAVYNTGLTEFFTSANTSVVARQICVSPLASSAWDQEENQPAPGGVVISPSPIVPGVPFCGEVGVLSINNGGVGASGTLKATVARADLTYAALPTAGWITISTPNATTVANPLTSDVGLPVVGSAFVRATAATGTFGVTWDHHGSRLNLQ